MKISLSLNSQIRWIALILLVLTGCATPLHGQKGLLDFIKDGQTNKEQTLLNLGEPSNLYEHGRILAYRLKNDDGGYYLIRKKETLSDFTYSLILVFNDQNILTKHALVRVRDY